MTFLGYETTQWNAWLNLPELESSGKFLYTSSLATFSTLRRLLSIVKVGRVPDLRDFEMARRCLIVALGRHCEASEEVGADSFITPPGTLCMHRKPNRVEGGPVSDWLTAMLRPVSHMNRSPSLPMIDTHHLLTSSVGLDTPPPLTLPLNPPPPPPPKKKNTQEPTLCFYFLKKTTAIRRLPLKLHCDRHYRAR